ncbi:MAG TPA: hypothetical protein VGI20_05375 [Rhizomicrobium sp.]|jgi:hypothetical protein
MILMNYLSRFRQWIFAPVAALILTSASPAGVASNEILDYRGFAVDLSAARNAPNLSDIESSVHRQIDIVADCGASPATLAFFRAQHISLSANGGDGGGRFNQDSGVQIDAAPEPADEPILLHEMLHAYHARVLPDGFRNPEIAVFYLRAKRTGLYPADAFVLSNRVEFFAITASLYLFGHVDRPPFTRENLRARQPYYYDWLGRQFGVRK